MLYYIILYYSIILYYITLYYIILYYIILYYYVMACPREVLESTPFTIVQGVVGDRGTG